MYVYYKDEDTGEDLFLLDEPYELFYAFSYKEALNMKEAFLNGEKPIPLGAYVSEVIIDDEPIEEEFYI